ncbi:hypothetical protein Tco_1485891, partial [Tanacetum coccineum]
MNLVVEAVFGNDAGGEAVLGSDGSGRLGGGDDD